MKAKIAVVVIENLQDTANIVGSLKKYGVNDVEITFRTAVAAEAIALAARMYPEMNIGAGTVINLAQCRAALTAGAKFIVSPGLDAGVAKYCRRKSIPYYPGCVTATEIIAALALGITTVKFFPANIYGGLAGIKALSAPFPQIRFIPTGGISKDNIDEYLALDAVVAVGASYFQKEALKCASSLLEN